MAKIGGAPTLAVVEMTCQNYYFAFQVIQVFLVVTIASSATTVVTKIIKEPQSAANLLATNIPKASNFYISYITLQGLSFASGTLLQIAGLILGKVLGAVLDTTPRKMYTRWSTMAGLGWGTVYPAFTLLAVVCMFNSSLLVNYTDCIKQSPTPASSLWFLALLVSPCSSSTSPTATTCSMYPTPTSTRKAKSSSRVCSISPWAATFSSSA